MPPLQFAYDVDVLVLVFVVPVLRRNFVIIAMGNAYSWLRLMIYREHVSPAAQWLRTVKNRDVSIGPLECPFARSLALVRSRSSSRGSE